jgi:hypothetical protein
MHGVSNDQIGIASLLIAIIALALAVVAIASGGGGAQTFTQLGVWQNMPSGVTELMGNTSYRGLLITRSSAGEGGISVGLGVNCITPSNTVGAILQLQYANYSDTTHVNTTNFVNIGIPIPIDNSANNPCPGALEGLSANLPSINTNPVIFVFRVVGSNGGGAGDNPRFSSMNVYVLQLLRKAYIPVIVSHGTTTFTYQIQSTTPLGSTTTVNAIWISTNQTGPTVCGTGDLCIQSGTTSCSISAGAANCATTTVTYGTAFSGTVEVSLIPTTSGASTVLPIGTISLLSAQTLTV